MNDLQTPLRACQSGDLFALFDADGNYLASIETAVTAAEIVRRCNEYEALQSQLLAQEAAVADAWNAERDELQKRLGEAERVAEIFEELAVSESKAMDAADFTIHHAKQLIAALKLRAEAAEAKLAYLASKGLTVEPHKDFTGHLAYVIEHGSVFDDGPVLKEIREAEAKLAAVRAAMEHQIKHPSLSGFGEILAIVKEPTNAE